VLEMMLDAVKQVRSGYEPPVGCEARQRSRMRADERVRCERVVLEGVPVRQWDVVPGIASTRQRASKRQPFELRHAQRSPCGTVSDRIRLM
jgi:hypothetical protein